MLSKRRRSNSLNESHFKNEKNELIYKFQKKEIDLKQSSMNYESTHKILWETPTEGDTQNLLKVSKQPKNEIG